MHRHSFATPCDDIILHSNCVYRFKSILENAAVHAESLNSSAWTDKIVRARLHNEENKRRRTAAAAAGPPAEEVMEGPVEEPAAAP